MKQVTCPDCGKTYNEDLQSCPNCGCPNDEYSQQTNASGNASRPSANKTTASTSKTCKECGHALDDNAQVCPNCGCPTETASAPAFMDGTVLNEGRSTEAESTISDLATSILKWGNILAKWVPIIMLIGTVINSIQAFSNGAVLAGIISIIIAIVSAFIYGFIIKIIAKLIWATIMLFVNISTTLKRIEIKLEENGTH
jgi:uncharacterized membrane protein YvbJ